MICDPCKNGGSLNQIALDLNTRPEESDYFVREELFTRAREWHESCEYPQSCACQHDVGRNLRQ